MPEVDGSFRTKNCSTLHPRIFIWSCIESIRPCFWLIAVIRFIERRHTNPVDFESRLIKIWIPSPPDSGYRLSINTFLEARSREPDTEPESRRSIRNIILPKFIAFVSIDFFTVNQPDNSWYFTITSCVPVNCVGVVLAIINNFYSTGMMCSFASEFSTPAVDASEVV